MTRPATSTPELRRLRRRIDALDRRIVGLLNERAELGRQVGGSRPAAGATASATSSASARCCSGSRWRTTGPLAQADLLAIYRRLIEAPARSRSTTGRGD